MKRGDVVTIAVSGDYGKPRPALVVQSGLFLDRHSSVTVLPMTSTLADTPMFRLTVEPNRRNGLTRVSQVMVDKILSVPRARVGKVIGRLDVDEMTRVGRAIALWVGLA